MECKAQSYWHMELAETNYSKNKSDTRYIKRQYHKARRQHDKELIEEHLNDLANISPDVFIVSMHDRDLRSELQLKGLGWKGHNHKYKIKEAV